MSEAKCCEDKLNKMAHPEQLAKLNEGVEAWNQWKVKNQEATVDLSEADLAGKDLTGADLQGALLPHASLRGTKMRHGTLLWQADLQLSDLCEADLSGADLKGVNFAQADLFAASLREADLQSADLSSVKGGLRTEQLAGADLTGAKLPDDLKTLYDKLENVKGISESARKIFLAVLAACLYCWLTIATTTDVNLITNRASSPLPIIQTPIPIVGFYVVAPLLVLCIYFYFHFYLQKLWEELGSLPAVFPDGRPLHAKVDPWLLNDLVRSHLPRLNMNRPFLSYFQLWISVLLAWWAVPITMLLFWGRYLRRHEQIGTAFHLVLLVISVVLGVRLYQLAVLTLRGQQRKAFTWKNAVTSRHGYETAALTVAAGILFGLISWGAIWGDRSSASFFGITAGPLEEHLPSTKGPRTWVPEVTARVGFPLFADLRNADISEKKPLVGASLTGANLRYAQGAHAYFSGAQLADADLKGANLVYADLSGAELFRADMDIAHLSGADLANAYLGAATLVKAHLGATNLRGAHLSWADLRDTYLDGADLSGSDLTYVDLRGADITHSNLTHADLREAKNLDPQKLKMADHWDEAFYDDDMLAALGLQPDHNKTLNEELKKHSEFQQKYNTAQDLLNVPPARY